MLKNKLTIFQKKIFEEIFTRVNYYNKINNEIKYPDNSNLLSEISLGKKKTIFLIHFQSLDILKITKQILFGDVNLVPEIPSL